MSADPRSTTGTNMPNAQDNRVIGKNISATIDQIIFDFGDSDDLVVRNVEDGKSSHSYAAIYLYSLVDNKAILSMSEILAELNVENHKMKPDQFFNHLQKKVSVLKLGPIGDGLKALYNEILDGNTVFLVDNIAQYFSVRTTAVEGRAISEPTSQTIIKGPKDSFVEEIDKNVRLLRRRIRNEALRIEDMTLGTVSHTKIKFMYIDGLAKPDIVKDIYDRLNAIVYDSILDSGYIEELFKTDKFSIFPTSLNSEKPDSVAAALFEGRIAILVDGTPYVITVPAIFTDFMQASEDYYYSYFVASAMRIIRYMGLLLTLLVPALFIALTTFHQEIIPTTLLISIAAQREGVAFPAFMEVLIMELSFEIIREAGIRMPRAIGPAIAIVGALVLGQAAVEAGLISALVVIVVAITAISSFTVSNYSMANAIRLLRFVFIGLSATLGFYGISMGLIILVLHLCKIKSASVPYLTPIAPHIKGGNQDTLLRMPLWSIKKRPKFTSASGTYKTNGPQTLSPSVKGKQEIK